MKRRTGGPIEDPEDMELPIWAGIVPLTTTAGAPVADPGVLEGVDVPASLAVQR